MASKRRVHQWVSCVRTLCGASGWVSELPTETPTCRNCQKLLALAKTAPKVAGPWCHDGKRVVAARYYGGGKAAAVVERSRNTLLPFRAKTLLNNTGHATKELAQSACDAALLAQGYVLDGDTP